MYELLKRYKTGNKYIDKATGVLKFVYGGTPNVTNASGNIVPLDNKITSSGDPWYVYKVNQSNCDVYFGTVGENARYIKYIKGRNGEWVKFTIKGATAIDNPTLINDHTIQWTKNDWKLQVYATNKTLKETLWQPAGKALTYICRLSSGLSVGIENQSAVFRLKSNNKVAFTIPRPYYIRGDDMIPINVTYQKVGNTYELTLPAPAQDEIVDPTLVFGEGSGADVSGTHKTTSIRDDNTDACYATTADNGLRVGYTAADNLLISLLRFDLSTTPSTAIIDSGTLTLKVENNSALPCTVYVYPLKVAYGITDTNGGETESTATHGQATWRRSFDYNGVGGDVTWTSGGFSSADYNASVDNQTVSAGTSVGTPINFTLTSLIQDWIDGTLTNNGIACGHGLASQKKVYFYSQSNATAAYRPELSVVYTAASVTVTAPNGGDSWVYGTAQNITWTSTGTPGNVKIELTRNNGSSWETIVASTSNDGTYEWTVSGTESTSCLIKITSVADGTITDQSNAVFTITETDGASSSRKKRSNSK